MADSENFKNYYTRTIIEENKKDWTLIVNRKNVRLHAKEAAKSLRYVWESSRCGDFAIWV